MTLSTAVPGTERTWTPRSRSVPMSVAPTPRTAADMSDTLAFGWNFTSTCAVPVVLASAAVATYEVAAAMTTMVETTSLLGCRTGASTVLGTLTGLIGQKREGL